jgi:hypothetical protein
MLSISTDAGRFMQIRSSEVVRVSSSFNVDTTGHFGEELDG